MTDTIDLLDTIGSDASLRYAAADELAAILEQTQASEALKSAVASSDRTRLFEELGQNERKAPQSVNTPGHEEDEQDTQPNRDLLKVQ